MTKITVNLNEKQNDILSKYIDSIKEQLELKISKEYVIKKTLNYCLSLSSLELDSICLGRNKDQPIIRAYDKPKDQTIIKVPDKPKDQISIPDKPKVPDKPTKTNYPDDFDEEQYIEEPDPNEPDDY